MDVGDIVPEFTATLHTGETVTLSELVADGPAVVFFYPKAFTPGCTAEGCHFRDLGDQFARLGASRVGVSRDDVAAQRDFVEKYEFDYPLIADPDGAIARIFGVKRLGPLWSKRVTFVVSPDRRVLGVVRSETNMQRHADEALRILASA